MKTKILLFLFLSSRLHAQVGVNVLTPHASSALQVESPSGTFKGLLTPSMTTTNRMALTTGSITPADGLVVYDVSHHMHYYYNAYQNKWYSMSPLVLSSPTANANYYPSGAITTPVTSVSTTYSLGINKLSPTQVLDVVGSATVSGNVNVGGTISGNAINVNGFAQNALVPAGAIIMWSGANIPNGWAQCDGTNGTPDLRGRFIVAAGQASSTTVPGDLNPVYTANSTGGENQHTLTTAELPRHRHRMNGDNADVGVYGGAHSHSADPSGQGLNAQRAGGNAGGLASDGTATIWTSVNNHTHPTSEFYGATGDGSTAGLNNQSHENRPQFYVLVFIMKL